MFNVILFLTFNLQTIMKQMYVKPQTREVSVNAEGVMVQMSTLMIEDLEVPPMGNYAPASFKDL